jgi:hypothetical protein
VIRSASAQNVETDVGGVKVRSNPANARGAGRASSTRVIVSTTTSRVSPVIAGGSWATLAAIRSPAGVTFG